MPGRPFTTAFGTTRRVNWDATISVDALRYSVPHQLIDTRVWARFHGDEHGATGEVARHHRGTPSSPVLDETHYPPREDKTGDRTPRARTAAEAAWLVEAGAAGTRRVVTKMAQAVALAKLYSPKQVDRALGTAAVTARFAESDLLSILDYQAVHDQTEPTRRSENHSLQPGTAA